MDDTTALAALTTYRAAVYGCCTRRRDAVFDLGDALATQQGETSLVRVSRAELPAALCQRVPGSRSRASRSGGAAGGPRADGAASRSRGAPAPRGRREQRGPALRPDVA